MLVCTNPLAHHQHRRAGPKPQGSGQIFVRADGAHLHLVDKRCIPHGADHFAVLELLIQAMIQRNNRAVYHRADAPHPFHETFPF